MKKIILFILLTSVLLPRTNFACTCFGGSSFCTSLTNFNGDFLPDVILRAIVTENAMPGFRLEVTESILGDIGDIEIVLFPDLCTSFNGLEVGSEFLFALEKHEDNILPLFCAVFFLKIEDGFVTGPVAPGVTSIAYDDLMSQEGCGLSAYFYSFNKDVLIYPNPTSNEIIIDNTHSNRSSDGLELSIYDIMGRAVKHYTNVEGILPEGHWVVNVQDLSAGLYVFKLSGKDQERIFKIVKQ